jgi:hypothetical protein
MAERPRGGLDVDRLEAGGAFEVALMDGFRVGEGPIRDPHRHDYDELLWVRSGGGRQRIDGEPLAVVPGTLTVVGRGQVHAEDLHGALLRFTDAALAGDDARRITAGWLLSGRGGRAISGVQHLEGRGRRPGAGGRRRAAPLDGAQGVRPLAARPLKGSDPLSGGG